jgi:hypothetical protein
MSDSDLYLGTWVLVPELSIYEHGPLPASATYVIEPNGAGVRVRLRWAMAPGGPEQSVVYGGPTDGSPQALPPAGDAPAGAPDALTLTRVDAHTLDSEALREGVVVAYGRRVADHTGQLLAVMQEARRPDGGRVRSFQVYRRDH